MIHTLLLLCDLEGEEVSYTVLRPREIWREESSNICVGAHAVVLYGTCCDTISVMFVLYQHAITKAIFIWIPLKRICQENICFVNEVVSHNNL